MKIGSCCLYMILFPIIIFIILSIIFFFLIHTTDILNSEKTDRICSAYLYGIDNILYSIKWRNNTGS